MKILIYFTMNQTVLWDSQMKAQKLKQGMGYIKSAMYWFDYSGDIIVEEEQQDNTLDRTIVPGSGDREGDRSHQAGTHIMWQHFWHRIWSVL